tara:strand:+ start:739 stop:1014 length:276 start_codon:yes stop_codon:yes gene_type:complete
MSESNGVVIVSGDEEYVWNANDWSNLITISASAIASVLLVVFKSRCTTINLCCGLLSCNRKPKEEEEEEEQTNPQPQVQAPPPQQQEPPNP